MRRFNWVRAVRHQQCYKAGSKYRCIGLVVQVHYQR
jgi:hypothetical protein